MQCVITMLNNFNYMNINGKLLLEPMNIFYDQLIQAEIYWNDSFRRQNYTFFGVYNAN